MGTLGTSDENGLTTVVDVPDIKVDHKQESIEDIQSLVLEQIQPRLGEVFKRLGNEVFPNINDEEECIEDEHAKYFLQLCFQSQEALDELKSVLQELDMKEACTQLEKLPNIQISVDESKEEVKEAVEKEVSEVQPLPYRDVLRESYGTMVDCLQLSTRMFSLLRELSVFNEDMISKIRCRPNRPDSVRTLLNFLLELGPKSLNGFIRALKETNQEYLANILTVHPFI